MNVKPGGSADQRDVDLVAAKLGQLPAALTDDLHRRGIGVVACRDSVTDYRRDLAGVHPRNWPEGMTWDAVPGCYLPDEKNVAIATIGDSFDRRVPLKGEKHGSFDLVVHEVMHADDYVADGHNDQTRRSANAAFVAARNGDVFTGQLAADAYEAKNIEEAYAESAARVFGGDPHMTWPGQETFWRDAALPVAPVVVQRRGIDDRDDRHIGTVTVLEGERFALDLTATDDGGAIGHAYVVLKPGDPGYDPVSERLRSMRRGFDEVDVPIPLAPF
jgi:hypothetical protein